MYDPPNGQYYIENFIKHTYDQNKIEEEQKKKEVEKQELKEKRRLENKKKRLLAS